jgi:CheY-like chemotaxis protein
MPEHSNATGSANQMPLALVVDDLFDQRNAKLQFLQATDFRVITADSLEEAQRELSACPLVDLVITDVNLNSYDRDDMSGTLLAQYVKMWHPGLPVVGYSAVFERDRLPQEAVAPFDATQLKGEEGEGRLMAAAQLWRTMAAAYRTRRLAAAEQELERLTAKYGLSSQDVRLLREFLPGAEHEELAVYDVSVDVMLRKAGYHLHIVAPGEVRPRVDNHIGRVLCPIPIWLQDLRTHFEAEVYGFPELYGSGATEEEAVRQVLLLMDGFSQDLADAEDSDLAPNVSRLRSFLQRAMGPS